MKKIGELSPKNAPTITIYYDDKAKLNPYRVYKVWNELAVYGVRTRRKMIAKYADLYSCAFVLLGYAKEYNEEGR